MSVDILGTSCDYVTLPAQDTTFNTLANWAIKPHPIKKEKDRKEKVKGYGPEHVYNTLGYIYTTNILLYKMGISATNKWLWYPKVSFIEHAICGVKKKEKKKKKRALSEKREADHFNKVR